ncbi:MAG: arylesterase [Rhizobiaceae bacterium]|nr:MAG: arylesterase [Rhizobiaceae bacterium]CAG0957477.1 acyl-CoA thioesterase I [Rhizobiaceae bacterium]
MAFKRFLQAAAVAIGLLAVAMPASADPVRVVGLGDSLMAGYGLGPGEAFPDKLQAALRNRGHDVVIENAGVSGDTSSGGLSRLDWSVPDGTAVVILELGANDMLRGIEPAITEKNLDAMVSRLKERGIAVLLAGMRAAPNLGPEFAAQFDPIYERIARTHGIALMPFFLDGVAADPNFLLADGMHPNATGVDVMVGRALPLVERLLEDAERAS